MRLCVSQPFGDIGFGHFASGEREPSGNDFRVDGVDPLTVEASGKFGNDIGYAFVTIG